MTHNDPVLATRIIILLIAVVLITLGRERDSWKLSATGAAISLFVAIWGNSW